MKVVFAASESSPFASTGGLGDVAQSLPRTLHAMGVEILRILPLYRQVAEGDFQLVDTGMRLKIPIGFRFYQAEIWTSDYIVPTTYFIRRDEFFDRRALYNLPERDYDDNFERFLFFQKAVVALLDALHFEADVVHCNDWNTGLIPLLLKHGIHGVGRGGHEASVFTIHNLAFQGVFPDSDFPLTNLPFGCFSIDMLEFYGQVNCLKAGLMSADITTTVSPRYAREIRTPEFGCGLDGALKTLGEDRLEGILNGIEYDQWDPSTDGQIEQNYSADRLDGKAACKRALQDHFHLPRRPDCPLLCMVTRLTDQKGMDLLVKAMESLLAMDIQFVLLGSGMKVYQDLCAKWAAAWSQKVGVHLGFDPPLAHRFFAGADLFLMPSRFEPCGLGQLYALRYGTLPVVHAVGGLDDTIRDIDEVKEMGNGIKFREYTAEALVESIQRALAQYHADPKSWQNLLGRMMACDYSWKKSAQAYLGVYQRAQAHHAETKR